MLACQVKRCELAVRNRIADLAQAFDMSESDVRAVVERRCGRIA
jgi:hypothetical protein